MKNYFAGTRLGGKTPGEELFAYHYRLGQAAVLDLKDLGEFRKTLDGRLFYCYQDADNPRIIQISPDEMRLHVLISDLFQVNAASQVMFNTLIKAMRNECEKNGLMAEVHQFCHLDRKSPQTIYLSLMDGGHMLKIRGDGAPLIVPNGTDSVFFLEDKSWEPWTFIQTEVAPVRTGALKKYLVDCIGFDDSDALSAQEQKWLFGMWIRVLPMDLPEKPILLMYGEHGSGKTLALQRVLKALFGRLADVGLVSKEEDFRASVTNNAFFALDNADAITHDWFGDKLAATATGATFAARELYTTNQEVKFPSRAWIGLTSRTPSFMNDRPDIADRMLIFTVARPKRFQDRQIAFDDIREHRNEILTDLAIDLDEFVARWRGEGEDEITSSPFRITSFGVAVDRYAAMKRESKTAERVWKKLEMSQIEMVIQNDPILCWLREYLGTQETFAGTGQAIADAVNESQKTRHTSRSVGQKMRTHRLILENFFGMVKKDIGNRKMIYSFQRI